MSFVGRAAPLTRREEEVEGTADPPKTLHGHFKCGFPRSPFSSTFSGGIPQIPSHARISRKVVFTRRLQRVTWMRLEVRTGCCFGVFVVWVRGREGDPPPLLIISIFIPVSPVAVIIRVWWLYGFFMQFTDNWVVIVLLGGGCRGKEKSSKLMVLEMFFTTFYVTF